MKWFIVAVLVVLVGFVLAVACLADGGVTVKGVLSWQGHGPPGTARWQQYIWVTLPNQSPWQGCTTQTSAWGEFSCQFSAKLPYPLTIEIHNGHTLSTAVKVLGAGPVYIGVMVAGDVSQDNKIDKETDFETCLWAIGSTCPSPGGCYLSADIDDDQAVTTADCTLIEMNMGQQGPVQR